MGKITVEQLQSGVGTERNLIVTGRKKQPGRDAKGVVR
jgi:hypothetical protein